MGVRAGRAMLLVTVIAASVATSAGCGSTVTAGPSASLALIPTALIPTATSPAANTPTPIPAPKPSTVHWIGEPANWRGPSDPRVGVSYPFDLLTHCGIGTTRFGGRYWHATTPRPEPSWRPGVGGIYTYDGYTAGTMTLLSDDLLRFLITDPQVVGDGDSVDFTPLLATAPPPLPCD